MCTHAQTHNQPDQRHGWSVLRGHTQAKPLPRLPLTWSQETPPLGTVHTADGGAGNRGTFLGMHA